jgi:hypothetical protein
MQPPPTTSIYTYKKGYYKVSVGKLRAKQSVGSSSVPLPVPKDASVSKPSSAPVKSKVQPVPFNQYGSNIPSATAFENLSSTPNGKGGRASPILLSEEDSPPPEPDTFKIKKMTPAEHAEVGWESP